MKRRVFTVHINEDGSAEVFWKSEVSAGHCPEGVAHDPHSWFRGTLLTTEVERLQCDGSPTVNEAAILDRDAFLATMLSRTLSAIQAGARW